MVLAYEIFEWVQRGLFIIIALAGLYIGLRGALVRDDAYEAADRHSKWIWVGLVGASVFMVGIGFPLLSWVGIIVIGLFAFDVYPHVRDIEAGEYDW